MPKEIGRAIRNTLGDALDRAVRRTPDKIALLFAERRWTYCDLGAAAKRRAPDPRHLRLAYRAGCIGG